MKSGRKRGMLGVLLLALLLVLTACTAGEKKPDTPETAAAFKPRMDGQTECEVTVAGHYSNFEALEAEFNRFAEYYPKVQMNYTCLDDYNGVILTALGSSEPPDIFFTYPWMGTREGYETVYQTAENLADPELEMDLSGIRENLLTRDRDGRVPSVPVYITPYGMLVNEDIFSREKIDIPVTYEGLTAACEALQKAGYANPVMAFNGSNFLLLPLYYPYLCAQLWGNEAALSDLNGMKPGAGEHLRGSLALAEDFMSRGFLSLEACGQLENDYNAVILRFFEGDVPMMLCSANTVSGTEKRESQSEAFSTHPFRYSFHPVPSTAEGGYFVNTVSMGFAVNSNSRNLEMANEFMRFLLASGGLNRMAQAKRMVTPCTAMSLDGIYAAFGQVDPGHVINLSEMGLADQADAQIKLAGWRVAGGQMTAEEAAASFGSIK